MQARRSSRKAQSPRARIEREAEAFDDGSVMANNLRWKARVPHVMNGPNSRFGNERFRRLLGERVAGSRVLEMGCGCGELSRELHEMGASTIYAFDVSSHQIEEAQDRCRDLAGLTFHVQAILHHIDFREILVTLFETNLRPGGRMIFLEPMSHPLTLGFYRFARSAHTPDEWPITPADVRWLQQRFAASVVPINLLSFPAGVVSSLVMSSDENQLMRLADHIDRNLERRTHLLGRGREGIIVIDRPSGRPDEQNGSRVSRQLDLVTPRDPA
jgi:SAM-dependent methyltransferase